MTAEHIAPLRDDSLPAVPWITAWSGEDVFDVRPCRWADGAPALWQPFAQGEGAPRFKSSHVVRIRRAMAEMLCQLCGDLTPDDDRWIIPAGSKARTASGLTAAYLHEPPLHRKCIAHALVVCPALAPFLDRFGLKPIPLPAGFERRALTRTGSEINATYGTSAPPKLRITEIACLAFPAWAAVRAFPGGFFSGGGMTMVGCELSDQPLTGPVEKPVHERPPPLRLAEILAGQHV